MATMTYDVEFYIVDEGTWEQQLQQMTRLAGGSELIRSVRLTVPSYGLRNRIRDLLEHTGHPHFFVTVPYIQPVPTHG